MLDYNDILERTSIEENIKENLQEFENDKNSNKIKRGFYIYGEPGIGKTTFVKKILNKLDYDIIIYNASNIRNKSIIDELSKNNMSDTNVVSMFYKKKKKISIIMDEIDGMNSGDKGGITSLITLIRNKKTKKQQNEISTPIPIFCISNNEIDKKITELMKISNNYSLKEPTAKQIQYIIESNMPLIKDKYKIVKFVQNDLRKLECIQKVYNKNLDLLNDDTFYNFFLEKSIVDNSKNIVKQLYTQNVFIKDYNDIMNENDRTIVGLLWHENVSDVISNPENLKEKFSFYKNVLENICYADYIDRITFQKQIWQLNELSSFIKIFFNNYLLHNEYFQTNNYLNEIRFTKILTKYSTEYNNYKFFESLSYKMQIDKKDIIKLFCTCKNNYDIEKQIVENFELTNLEISRIYRYIDNYF